MARRYPRLFSGLQILAQLQTLESKGKPGFVARLARRFLDDTPQQVATMHGAQQRGDVAVLARVAHRLKGSCITMGATRMAQLCRDIEKAAQGSDLAGEAELMVALTTECARVCARLESIS